MSPKDTLQRFRDAVRPFRGKPNLRVAGVVAARIVGDDIKPDRGSIDARCRPHFSRRGCDQE
jgi:predicted transcriptional regulator